MKWEYNSVRIGAQGSKIDWTIFDDVLTRRGADGWELVSTETLHAQGATSILLLCFKRPLETTRPAGRAYR